MVDGWMDGWMDGWPRNSMENELPNARAVVIGSVMRCPHEK